MKKIISVVLCIALLVSAIAIPSFAAKNDVKGGTLESAFAEGKDSLIVFILFAKYYDIFIQLIAIIK